MSAKPRRLLAAFSLAALAGGSLLLAACAGPHTNPNAEGSTSTRPAPENAPKRPADLTPPPPPSPGHTNK